MNLYVIVKDQKSFYFSVAPDVDKLFSEGVRYLDQALPLELLQRYLENFPSGTYEQRKTESLEEKIAERIYRGLKKDGLSLDIKLKWRSDLVYSLRAEEERILKDNQLFALFCCLFQGRIIAEKEYCLFAEKLNIAAGLVPKLFQRAVNEAKGKWVPAVRKHFTGWCCERCGSTDIFEWPAFYGIAATCQGCKSIGALNSLQTLFVALPEAKTSVQIGSNEDISGFDFTFSAAQRQAAAKLLEYDYSAYREILIWAACGAGKTEICFPLIKKYLTAGRKVLFAAPRQDVVHDVALRLRRSFSNYKLKVLSGALSPDLEATPLTVATTHQILRFFRAFDLIIFDEMDAYPYANNEALAYGMRQALKEDGRMVYLTATPTEEVFAKIAKNFCALIRLPARHHGRPLPVPEIIKIKLPLLNSKQEFIEYQSGPHKLKKILEELLADGPLLVFVPRIDLVEKWVVLLKKLFPTQKVSGSWSGDPKRTQKIAAFLAGEVSVFVCTSILERGITVNQIQVVVLYADHGLYDVRALVQMTGRTGRTSQAPTGRALLIGSKTSKAMKEAVKWISDQNKLAWEQGFLG